MVRLNASGNEINLIDEAKLFVSLLTINKGLVVSRPRKMNKGTRKFLKIE